MDRFICAVLAAAAVFISVSEGCVPSPPESSGEEIVLNSWELVSEGKTRGSLDFTDGKIIMSADVSDGKLRISGDCYFSDKTITIDSEDCGVIAFDYELYRDKLRLTFGGKTAEFTKKPQNSDASLSSAE